jgi:hypothetical protein
MWKLTAILLVTVGLVAIAAAVTDTDWMTKHLHQMGGPNKECVDCHNGVKADEPPVLKGRYANMGGPRDQGCYYCHNGEKAPLLPLPPEYSSCAGEGGCHPTK